MSRHTVLHVRRYDFADSLGQRVTGCKVTYLEGQPEIAKDSKGLPILIVNAPLEVWDNFQHVPGKYELDFRQKPDSKGKPTLILKSAQFVDASDQS